MPPSGAAVVSQGSGSILDIVRHVRDELDAARRTGNYGEFLSAVAELRRLAGARKPGKAPPAEPGTAEAARALFVELRGVVHRGVRVDALRWAAVPAPERST
jgi:hypothetical protein